MDFYTQENVKDHGEHPHNWGLLADYQFHATDENPLCGDQLELTLKVDEDSIVTEVGWDGQGCLISKSAASMLGDALIGKSLDEIKQITSDEVLAMLGIPITMSRHKCALLSLKIAKAAAYNVERWTGDDD
jgi:nitrogen fixation protein NifU and related proteins